MLKKRIFTAVILSYVIAIAIYIGWPLVETAYARTVARLDESLGAFTGPRNGTAQDDNVKASLDLLHNLVGPYQTKGTGSIFYCDASGSGGAGTSWTTAKKTLDAAIGLCTHDAGDIILVADGHAENISTADGADADVRGITIIGMGVGENRPVFSYTNANGEIVIGADDVKIKNLVLLAHVTDVTTAINVETGAENFVISGCDFVVDTEATDEFTDAITITANCDNGIIENCNFFMGGGGAQTAISNVGGDYLKIIGNNIYGDYAQACVENVTTVALMMLIEDNNLYNGDVSIGLNTEPCIELKSDTTAVIRNNACICNVAIAELAIVAADAHLINNHYNEVEGTYGSRQIGLVAGQTYAAQTTTSTAFAEDLFAVAGGEILITSFVGRVVTAIAADGGNLHVWCDATTAAQDIVFSTAVAVEGDAEGTLWCFDLDDGQAVLNPEENAGGSTYGNWYCPIGMIEQSNTDADATGVIVWSMTFIPLVDGVTVTPQ